MTSGLTLHHGDALRVLPTIPSGSVDLVLTDPPYLFGRVPRVRAGLAGALDGGTIDWPLLFRELCRVLRDDTAMALFGHVSSFLRLGPVIESAGFSYVTDIVWVKPGPVNFLQARVKPLSQHELITIWKKGRLRYNYEEAKVPGKPYRKARPRPRSFYDVEAVDTDNRGYRYMTDVIRAPNKCHLPKEERTGHPTQKPIGLVKQLVRAFSFPGGTVLDPFVGSGTTMAACRDLRRGCIGIEVNKEYVEMCRKRLDNAA